MNNKSSSTVTAAAATTTTTTTMVNSNEAVGVNAITMQVTLILEHGYMI